MLRCRVHFLLEVAVDLEHVAHLVGAREAEAADTRRRRRRCTSPAPMPRPFDSFSLISSKRQALAGDADGLADVLVAGLEDAVGAPCRCPRRRCRPASRCPSGTSSCRRPRRPSSAPGRTCRGCPSRTRSRRYVVGRPAKYASASALASKCGTRYLLLQHRHALVVGRHQLARVFERRPDHVLHAGGLGGVGDVLGLRLFLLAGEVLPEVGDARRRRARRRTPSSGSRRRRGSPARLRRPAAASALALSLLGSRVIARTAKPPFGSARIARHEPAALRARRAHDCNDLLVSHRSYFVCNSDCELSQAVTHRSRLHPRRSY